MLQLQPGDGFEGLFGAAARVAALKQLRLKRCELLGQGEGLEEALSQLPVGLEHLSIHWLGTDLSEFVCFPTGVL